MTTDAISIDPDTLAILRENGIDPEVYLKRQAELAAERPTPEAVAKLAAEKEALRPEIEAYNAFIDEHGVWSDGYRAW